MKHHLRTFACGTALAITLLACGGRQTMASKSAAAYDEAKKSGVPIAEGEHGGHHDAEPSAASMDHTSTMDHAAMSGMDHSQMSPVDHAQMSDMDHSTMPSMDHSKMSASEHAQMSGMDHATMPAMNHATMSATEHAQMHGMDHATMPAMDHSTMSAAEHAQMRGAQASQPAGPPASSRPPLAGEPDLAAPTSNSAIARIAPASTLRADEFDAPASQDAAPKPNAPAPAHHHHGGAS